MRRVLAIDGGGIRGVVPASFLAWVEDNVAGGIGEYFDLVVGTSTGGIIALAIGAGLPATRVRDLYIQSGPQIFPQRLRSIRRALGLASARYDSLALREPLRELLGDTTIGQSRVRLVVPSMDLASGRIHLWKTQHLPRFLEDAKHPMLDAAMATCAAPTYFEPFVTESGLPLADGGLFANSPAGLAAVEAVGVLGWPPDDVVILSLGCGSAALNIRVSGRWRHGLVGWAPHILDTLMTAQSDASCGTAIHLIRDPSRFFRVSPSLPQRLYGLDTSGEVKTLSAIGASCARHAFAGLTSLFETKVMPFSALGPG